MGIRELARRLELSPALISRLVKRGMPVTSVEAALAWRQQYVKTRKEAGPPPVIPIEIDGHNGSGGHGHGAAGDLEATLERLREQERDIAAALSSLLKEGRLSEAAALRREHVGTVKALFDAESRALKIGEARGRLIRVSVALELVNNSIQAGLLVLRRLPELGRTPEERARLEAFLSSVLNEFRAGAAGSVHSEDGEAAKENV